MLALIDYLPNFMQQFKEFQVIMNTSQPFVDSINSENENFLSDLFILESTENGVNHYEKMLNITPKLTQTLDDRQYTIFLKYNETLPYTYKKLIEVLNSICEEGQYKFYLSSQNLTLHVKLNLKKKSMLETVENLLDEVIPVNIEFSVDLLYNLWSTLNNKIWSDFSNFTWNDLREEDLV